MSDRPHNLDAPWVVRAHSFTHAFVQTSRADLRRFREPQVSQRRATKFFGFPDFTGFLIFDLITFAIKASISESTVYLSLQQSIFQYTEPPHIAPRYGSVKAYTAGRPGANVSRKWGSQNILRKLQDLSWHIDCRNVCKGRFCRNVCAS